MKLIDKMLSFFAKGPSGAAHQGATKVLFTDVYAGFDGWYFSYHDAKHTEGEVFGPYLGRKDVTFLRREFVNKRVGRGFSYVHQGVPYVPA